MTPLRHKYCMCAFKAILVVIGVIFFAEQASFEFYRFASYPYSRSGAVGISHRSIFGGESSLINYNGQAKINLSLDKRYDLKHVFIAPFPLLRVALLPVKNCKRLNILSVAIAAGENQVISMRGPPSFC
jgi:hypothetical protein